MISVYYTFPQNTEDILIAELDNIAEEMRINRLKFYEAILKNHKGDNENNV